MKRTCIMAVVAAVVVMGHGCGEDEDASGAGRGLAARPAAEAPVLPDPPSRAALVAGVRSFIEEWRGRENAFLAGYETRFRQRITDLGWFKITVGRAYEARRYGLIFSDGRELRPAASIMIDTLAAVESHGLDPAPYRREALEPVLASVTRRQEAYAEVIGPLPDERERTLWNTVERLRGSLTVDERTVEVALEADELDDEDLPSLSAASERLARIFEAKEKLNDALVELDTALLQRWFRYAYDMRFALRAHPFDADPDDGHGVERCAEKLFTLYLDTDFDQLEPALALLVPRLPTYPAMQKGLAFYEALAASDEQQVTLPKAARRLKSGKHGDLVEKLQTRLIQEGYLAGKADGKYGDSLAEAVRLYQETHQIKRSGHMDGSTRRSLNRTWKTRADQVRLALQRHRESELHQGELRFGDAPVQARVNIPAFEVVFYRNGQEARRHKLVVGMNDLSVDERTGHKGYHNRTRLFTEEIRQVTLNPTWRVTPRIKAELDEKLLEEPDFYEKHGYAVKIRDDGTEAVVQLPGPDNALGLVKFLFPNRFAIYMHDTPKKAKFRRQIRVGSHGCMRTQDATELAKWILIELEGMPPERFDEILATRKVYGVPLKTKIPLTIEYNAVGVHSSGRMMFYSDVYHFDRDLAAGKTPYQKRRESWLEQAVLVP